MRAGGSIRLVDTLRADRPEILSAPFASSDAPCSLDGFAAWEYPFPARPGILQSLYCQHIERLMHTGRSSFDKADNHAHLLAGRNSTVASGMADILDWSFFAVLGLLSRFQSVMNFFVDFSISDVISAAWLLGDEEAILPLLQSSTGANLVSPENFNVTA
jgi:hypothetical protein